MVGRIIEKEFLSYEESVKVFEDIAKGVYSEPQIASILTAIKLKGESPEIIRAAMDVFNKYKVSLSLGENIVDTCGTGGDGKHSINISSAVAITLASMGKRVVKHGNRAQSGKIGSADIFESLGIPVNLNPEDARDYFNKHNFVFLFAPLYHPAFKYVATVRKQLGFPTVFNYLGPFLNPANPDYQIVGINRSDKIGLLKEACLNKNYKKLIIYSSCDGYDEVSSKDLTVGYEIDNGKFGEISINPSEFFEPFDMPFVESREDGIRKFINGISGKDEKISSLIALNTGLGLYAMGDVNTIKDGYIEAKTFIKKGGVIKKLESLKS